MANIFALESPTYQPAMRIVSAITRANPAVITTSFDHDFGTGQIVRFFLPTGDDDFGMREINGRIGTITVTGATTFSIDIDTTKFNAFSIPASAKQNAQVIGFAEINSTLEFATRNVL